jgi:hypothetical protein
VVTAAIGSTLLRSRGSAARGSNPADPQPDHPDPRLHIPRQPLSATIFGHDLVPSKALYLDGTSFEDAALDLPDSVRVGSAPSLLHFVGNAPWSDERVLAKVRELVLALSNGADRSRPGSSTIRGSQEGATFGRVTRQYCGQLGKENNCQVAVTRPSPTMWPACPSHTGSICRTTGATDSPRRDKADVPEQTGSRPSPRSRLIGSTQPARPASPAAQCGVTFPR